MRRASSGELLIAARVGILGEVGSTDLANDAMTARIQAGDSAPRLSGRILKLQDEERRRIARQLHDSLGQSLTAAKINLDLLSLSLKGKPEYELISECIDTIGECLTETRTLSHLLHPPLLDEAGFAPAARWYAEGLEKRSGIQVDLNFPPELARLDRHTEITLYRSLQEGLTNVYRHSSASTVNVLLGLDAEHIRLELRDNGKGMSQQMVRAINEGASFGDTGSGIGLPGMRERIRELGGSLAVASNELGTHLIVTIPLERTGDLSDAEYKRSSAPGGFSMA